jgi:hypothetical protein
MAGEHGTSPKFALGVDSVHRQSKERYRGIDQEVADMTRGLGATKSKQRQVRLN